jgi:hypothetical protein
MPDDTETFDQWAIVELMGHVRLAGRLTEESHFGSALGRIDIPKDHDLAAGEDAFITQFFGGASVYRITPVSEEAARQVARMARPAPIYRLALTAAPPRPSYEYGDDDDPEPL